MKIDVNQVGFNMTPKEFKEFYNSDKGKELRREASLANRSKFDKEAVNAFQQKLADEWELSKKEGLEKAKKMCAEEMPEFLNDKEAFWAFCKVVTENIQVEKGFVPPGWTGSVVCESCGSMPMPPEYTGGKVVGCPWCHTEAGKAIREMKSECSDIAPENF